MGNCSVGGDEDECEFIRSLSEANCEWNNDTCQLIDGFTNEKKQLTNMFQGFTYPDEYVYLQ